jgi:hypothetical protein
MGVKYPALPLGRFNPGEITPDSRCIGYWVKSRAALDFWRREKSPSPTGIRATFPLSPAIAQSLYRLRHYSNYITVYKHKSGLTTEFVNCEANYAQESQNDPFESS